MNAKKSTQTFSDDERAAMRERAKEQKAAARKQDGEEAIREKLAEMDKEDRAMAERVHEIIRESVPDLIPKTWYGMPAYEKDGSVVCFFQNAKKFKARYSTLGFNDAAQLDDGDMWPTSFALKALTPATESAIADLVKKAAG